MLALSDGRSRAGTYRRHAPGVAVVGPPHSGGGPNLAACSDLALAITCWRSLTWRTRTDMCRRHVPRTRSGGGPDWAPAFGGWPRLDPGPLHSGGGPDWTPWKWSSSSTGGGSRAILAGGPIGVAAWGHSLGGGPNLAACGDLALANTCWRSLTWRTRTDMCRRHAPGTRSGGGPHWASAFGGRNRGVAPIGSCWRSLTAALRRARTGDTFRGPVPGVALIGAPQLGGWPRLDLAVLALVRSPRGDYHGSRQFGRVWCPHLDSPTLALSDWRPLTGALWWLPLWVRAFRTESRSAAGRSHSGALGLALSG